MSEKPSCKEFIIAAIRTVRPKMKNLRPGTSTGAHLQQIFAISREIYPEEEFRANVNELVKEGTIIMDAWREDPSGWSKRSPLLDGIPDETRLDEQGRASSVRGGQYRGILMYIKADGLPKRFGSSQRALAEQICNVIQAPKP